MSETLLQPESSYKVFIIPEAIQEFGLVAGFIFGRLMMKTNCGLHGGLLSNSEILSTLNLKDKHAVIKAKNVLKNNGLIFSTNEDNPRGYEYGINIHHDLYKKIMGNQARTETELVIPEWCEKHTIRCENHTSVKNTLPSVENTPSSVKNTLGVVWNSHHDSVKNTPYHYIHNKDTIYTNNHFIGEPQKNDNSETTQKTEIKTEEEKTTELELKTSKETLPSKDSLHLSDNFTGTSKETLQVTSKETLHNNKYINIEIDNKEGTQIENHPPKSDIWDFSQDTSTHNQVTALTSDSDIVPLKAEILQPCIPAVKDSARPSSTEEVLAYFTACKEMKIKEYPCLRDYDPKLETEVFLNKCISNEWKRTEGGKAKPIKKWKSYAYNFFTHWIQWNKNRSTQSAQVGLDEFFNSF